MASEALVRREVATEAGLLTLFAPAAAGDPARPLAIAIPGLFAGDEDLMGAPGVLGIYGEGCVVPLSQAGLRAGWTVAALASALEALIATAFPERSIVLMGASIGATVALAVRSPEVRRIVAVEPILATEGLWPIEEPLRRAAGPLPADDARRRRWFELFGVSPEGVEPRDHRGVLAGLACPVDVILGAEPLEPRRELARFPSLVGEAERRALAANPHVRIQIAPGVGHNVQGNAGKLVAAVLVEACRRAADVPGYDIAELDEGLLDATPVTARRVVHWGAGGEAFRAAFLARNPQAEVVFAREPSEGPEADAVVVGACPDAATLRALADRLAAEGRLLMRWTREGAPEADAGWLAGAGLGAAEIVEPGIVRLSRAEEQAEPALHLETLAFAPLLMDIRTRLPARMLRTLPDLSVGYRTEDLALPRLPRETPKVAVLERPAAVDPSQWISLLAPLIANDWVVVMEYDDHPAVVAELRGGHSAEARMRRMGFVHAVQTTTPPLLEAFREVNPEVALFPNAVFELLPFPEQDRGQRIFYGGVIRGDYPVEVARALGPVAAEFPEASFVVIGDEAVFKALPGANKVFHPYLSFEAYLAEMARCTVSLSPMEAKPLRETKSDAKYLDAARAGVVTIASPAAYDRTIAHGVNGFLARELADWPSLLAALLRDPAARRKVARAAWEDVRDHRMFAHQAAARLDWYWSLWRRREALTEALMARLPGLAEAVAAQRR